MRQRGLIDPDLLLTARYLDRAVTAEEKMRVEERLATELEFVEKIWGLFIAWLNEERGCRRGSALGWLMYGRGGVEARRFVPEAELRKHYGMLVLLIRRQLPRFDMYLEFRERTTRRRNVAARALLRRARRVAR